MTAGLYNGHPPVLDDRPVLADDGGVGSAPSRAATFPEPEDRGTATLSALGGVEYVEDIVRPGRIVVVAAEEGSGKSFAFGGELAIRVAVAGGAFAGTWPIRHTGVVLYLSEMHADDDFERETVVLASLGLERSALAGRYYRLPLMTAAGGRPALTDPEWLAWVTAWLRDRRALLAIIDTATGGTQVDPWGPAIQKVYADLRAMLVDRHIIGYMRVSTREQAKTSSASSGLTTSTRGAGVSACGRWSRCWIRGCAASPSAWPASIGASSGCP